MSSFFGGSFRARTRCFLTLLSVLTFFAESRADWSWKSDTATATRSNGRLVLVFTFHNDGGTPLTVSDVMFGCSCTKFTYSATTATPKGDGVLRVTLDSDDFEEPVVMVAFGSEGATPKPLSVRIPKPLQQAR